MLLSKSFSRIIIKFHQHNNYHGKYLIKPPPQSNNIKDEREKEMNKLIINTPNYKMHL